MILKKVFILTTTNQNVERASDDQSDVHPLPSYSQVYFDNTNASINMQFGSNQQTDDRRSDVNDGLPSYESLKVLPPPYTEE